MKKILIIAFFISLTSVASAHLDGWQASLKANPEAPGIFNIGTGGTAVVSPLRDIQFVASITGDSAGDIMYSFQCDKSSNTPTSGVVKLATANQTAFVDLTCKFPGEGDYSPSISFESTDGAIVASMPVTATFNPSEEQIAQGPSSTTTGFPMASADFIVGVFVGILAAMIYKFAPDRGPK